MMAREKPSASTADTAWATFSSVSSSRLATAALRADTLLRSVVRLARNTRSWLTSRG